MSAPQRDEAGTLLGKDFNIDEPMEDFLDRQRAAKMKAKLAADVAARKAELDAVEAEARRRDEQFRIHQENSPFAGGDE